MQNCVHICITYCKNVGECSQKGKIRRKVKGKPGIYSKWAQNCRKVYVTVQIRRESFSIELRSVCFTQKRERSCLLQHKKEEKAWNFLTFGHIWAQIISFLPNHVPYITTSISNLCFSTLRFVSNSQDFIVAAIFKCKFLSFIAAAIFVSVL